MKDSPIYLIQIPLSYMNLTEQLVIMLTALSDFNSWNMNIALQTLQLFLQKQLPCSLAFSALLVIVVHVLATCLAFWELLSCICCSKHALPTSLRELGEFVLVPHLRLVSWKASQKTATCKTICSTFAKQHRKSCRFFCRQLKRESICKGSKILYMSLHSIPGNVEPCLPLCL